MSEIYDRITSAPSSVFEFRFGKVTKKFSGWLIPRSDRTEFFVWRKTLTSNIPEVYKPKGRDNAGWYIVDSVLPTKSAKREVKTLKRDLSLSIHNKHFTYKKDVYAYCKNLQNLYRLDFWQMMIYFCVTFLHIIQIQTNCSMALNTFTAN